MPNARENPHEYPRRILIAVTGLSPQIVTETLSTLPDNRAIAYANVVST